MSETRPHHDADGGTPPEGEADGEKFLLAEYAYVSTAIAKNEDSGERRVNFLITLATAVLTAIVVALVTRQGTLDTGQIGWIAFAACLALLVVGLMTFARMIRRNAVTDEYKVTLDAIRDAFRRHDRTGLLAGYAPFHARHRRGWGGLTDLVAVINSISVIVAAAAAAVVVNQVRARVATTLVGLAWLAASRLQFAYLGRLRRARPSGTRGV